MGKKIARNCSLSYGFRDIHTFSFSAKIQDGRQKGQKFQFFPLCIGCSCTTLWVKNSLELAVSLTVFEIFTFFYFPQYPRRPPKLAKIEIFPLCIAYSCTTVRVKNSLKIALSCTVFEIFTLFHFPLKSKMAAKGGEN